MAAARRDTPGPEIASAGWHESSYPKQLFELAMTAPTYLKRSKIESEQPNIAHKPPNQQSPQQQRSSREGLSCP
jgi:hypothetical protein